jgi:hypothetical protein
VAVEAFGTGSIPCRGRSAFCCFGVKAGPWLVVNSKKHSGRAPLGFAVVSGSTAGYMVWTCPAIEEHGIVFRRSFVNKPRVLDLFGRQNTPACVNVSLTQEGSGHDETRAKKNGFPECLPPNDLLVALSGCSLAPLQPGQS